MTEQVQTPAPEVQEATLSIQDIALAVRVIDVAAERGAFKGPDLEPVGTLRNKLAKFVEANTAPAETKEEQPAAAE